MVKKSLPLPLFGQCPKENIFFFRRASLNQSICLSISMCWILLSPNDCCFRVQNIKMLSIREVHQLGIIQSNKNAVIRFPPQCVECFYHHHQIITIIIKDKRSMSQCRTMSKLSGKKTAGCRDRIILIILTKKVNTFPNNSTINM